MTPTDLPSTVPLPKAPIQRMTRPFRRFLEIESASGVVLVICAAVALVVANSPAAHAFHHFWELPFRVGVGRFTLEEPLHFWVNDALMTLFFFVVGLEIKRELVAGELSTPQKAALPVVAALGGMLAPAGVYLALMHGTPGEKGWGVPMATDIAFVVGVLALFGPRVPIGLKVFLLSLAIADDIGAILVIAAVYSGSPDPTALGAAAGGFGIVYSLNRLGVRTVPVYLAVGAGIWLAVLRSGVHPTIAGVLLGLMTPASAWVGRATLKQAMANLLGRLTAERTEGDAAEVGHHDFERLAFAAKESASPLERLEGTLHPWVGFAIMPLFALVNAGVAFRPAAVADPIAVAVALGLVLGKPLGIVAFSLLAVKLKLAQLPDGVTLRMLVAAGCLGGIGFTMSLFIAHLGLGDEHLDAGKCGILIGSGLSAVLGSGLLFASLPKASQ